MQYNRLVQLALRLHRSTPNLDPITTHEALIHDALHGACGLGVSIHDEHLIHNIAEILEGGIPLDEFREECESIISEIAIDDLVILTEALSTL